MNIFAHTLGRIHIRQGSKSHFWYAQTDFIFKNLNSSHAISPNAFEKLYNSKVIFMHGHPRSSFILNLTIGQCCLLSRSGSPGSQAEVFQQHQLPEPFNWRSWELPSRYSTPCHVYEKHTSKFILGMLK